MSRKRPASVLDETNNNDTVSQTMESKKRRTTNERLKAQLQSNLTEKFITPVKSPDGQPTSRFGRKINKFELQNTPRQRKSEIYSQKDQHPQQSKLSKRKVRKIFSIHNIGVGANVLLRLVSNRQSSVLTKSPIQKLISVTKIGLNNNQFQTQSTDNSLNTQPETVHLSADVSVSESNFAALTINCNENLNNDSSRVMDIEDALKNYVINRLPYQQINSIKPVEIIDEMIDLTSSPEGSEQGEDTTSNNGDIRQRRFSTIETETSITHLPNASQDKTDSPKKMTLTDMSHTVSTSLSSDTISFNDDKSFSEGRSDDCVITHYDGEPNIGDDNCSTDNWYVGQIVWAALTSYPFWPAMIFNETESQTFCKDNRIHVKFLYDHGRRNWVNGKSSILPFKSREEFIEKCKLPANKRNKAYKVNSNKKWELAVHEANVLLCIKSDKRVEFYDTILLKLIEKTEQEARSNRRKTVNRCDTPQTFDTAYSSMKQSSSPASLSPTLNELDQNYDVDKNINNYLISVELSHPEELHEDDLQMDETRSFANSVISSSSSEQIHCRLTNLAFEMFRSDDIVLDQSAILNENQFVLNLNELWLKITYTMLPKSSARTSLATKRTSRRSSSESSISYSSSFTQQQQTKRQKIIAAQRTALEQSQQLKIVEQKPPAIVKPSKEEIERKKQQLIEGTIRDCYIKSHPANFLLKGLAKDPVCQSCLKNGNVIRCAGKCSSFIHKHCLNIDIKESEYNGILKRKMRENSDDISTNETTFQIEENIDKLMCIACTSSVVLSCFVCKIPDPNCILCSDKNCGKAYHIECLKYWPQHKKAYVSNNIKSLHCPRHVCHTCVSPDIRMLFHNTVSDRKLIKCLQCPGTYHRSSECIPAGSELLSETQLICARHQIQNTKRINIDYCLFCSQGGTLICCDACPYSFHQDCLKVPVGEHFNCEECESGRRPLNGEIVWCKYHMSKWWPSIIVPPPRIPENVLVQKKEPNQICVYFFGTYEYGWVSQTNIYLFLTEDGECKNSNDRPSLKKAIAEAEHWMKIFNEMKAKDAKITNRPPPYRKIKTNKVIAKFKENEYTECKCRENDPEPCSTDSGCENKATLFECDPELCPAKEKCQNQMFHKGEQFAFEVKMTGSKGWGLFAKEEIPFGHFIIEYMGEVIDNIEFDQRFTRATKNKDDNYYFLILDKNLYIDAKFYGNDARFINHSCDPNAEPQKWTVYSNGQAFERIGLFALRNIKPGEELTFDYNWGTKNMETVCVCQCGSEKCRGHI